MHQLAENPVLGHLTTFGGHPLCCAAGNAAFEAMLEESHIARVGEKEVLFHALFKHPSIKAVRSAGLLMAVELENAEAVQKCLRHCIEAGLFSDWFLFAPDCIRIAPPLIISEEEIRQGCAILLECLGKAT